MIISASYKTDIPTFYGSWFLNRLRAGYCKMVNPYNRHAVYRVPLDRDHVDGFVFWTKNVGPFMPALNEVKSLGRPFVVQHTINGYPRELESRVIDPARSIEACRRVAGEHSARTVVWRYDTILYSSLTERDFHRRNFERLATALAGVTDEVVISFAQIYKKTERNVTAASREYGFRWWNPDDDEKRSLTSELVSIAKAQGMTLSVCAQAPYLVGGAEAARCIDARRLRSLGAKDIAAPVRGNRPECECHESKDIGDYDTCPHGCVYCYSVNSHELAQQRYREHDPASEFLFAPPEGAKEVVAAAKPKKPKTLSLFPED